MSKIYFELLETDSKVELKVSMLICMRKLMLLKSKEFHDNQVTTEKYRSVPKCLF